MWGQGPGESITNYIFLNFREAVGSTNKLSELPKILRYNLFYNYKFLFSEEKIHTFLL